MVFRKKRVNVYVASERIRASIKEVVSFMELKVRNNAQKVLEVWNTLEEGWCKINCDGGYVKENGLVGIGVVVRNDNGILVDGVCEPVTTDNPLVAKALTIKKGFNLAIEKEYQKVELEIDS